MDKIRVLSDGVANQIAAGEVVGRPASVVKELMENAVDAGSTSVGVHVKEGGRSLIQVIDDGCGMSESDARLAFERHATSKIKTAEDLYHLSSFGFRGEALPSIASVSETELRTRSEGRELGTKVLIQGGHFTEQVPVQAPRGTQLLVKNLFYNVPARRRFLKEPHVEARHVVSEFQRVVLCNPHVAFTLHTNDNPLYNLPAGNLRQRIAGVHGKPLANNLLEVSVDTSIVRIEGFTGHPSVAKKSGREQYFFVNGRYFRSPYFHKAVLKAYEKLIPADTQPPYFLYLTIDPERIDVNVHPSKTEIKFDDDQALWQILNAAVRESLGKLGVVPLMDFEMDPSLEIPVYQEKTTYKVPDTGFNPAFNPFVGENASPAGRAPERPAASAWEEQLYERDSAFGFPASEARGGEDSFDRSLIEFIEGEPELAQGLLEIESGTRFRGLLRLSDRYAVSALGDNLVMIHLPRARERVLYERYLALLGNNAAVSQQLLFPERVELSPEQMLLLNNFPEELAALGFEYHCPDAGSVELTGLPPELSVGLLAQTLHELLETLQESAGQARQERLRAMAALMARRGTAAGPRMADEAAEALLGELLACEDQNYTPQGLPILVWVTPDELKQRFR